MPNSRPEIGPSCGLVTIKRRADFLKVRGGPRWSGAAFLIELRSGATAGPARFGFTVTKKLGNAVVRNRIRRRLKHAARSAAVPLGQPGCDYVIVARPAALSRPFGDLIGDFKSAMTRLHAPAAKSTRKTL